MHEISSNTILVLILLPPFVWLCLVFVSWCIDWTLAWVEDEKSDKTISLVKFVGKLVGYNHDGTINSPFRRTKGKGSGLSTYEIVIAIFSLLFSAPFLIYLSIIYYPVTIGLLLLAVMAHMARFARRYKKLFDSHLKDKDAHK